MYATIDWCPPNYNDPPGISRFADLDAWGSVLNVWRITMSYGAVNPINTAFAAVVGLKEGSWDEGIGI